MLYIGSLITNPAKADNHWADGKNYEKRHQRESHREKGRHGYLMPDRSNHAQGKANFQNGKYFTEHDRTYLEEYIAKEFQQSHCPPVLDKKTNYCQPLGQVKKWLIDQPLPLDIEYDDIPPNVLTNISMPPSGHRYIRSSIGYFID